MKISIETLKKVKGIGKKTLQRIIEQHYIDNNLMDVKYVGNVDFENTIHNIDAIKLLENIKDESIDLILTDPPYKTTARGGSGNAGGMCKKKIFSSGMVFKYNDIEPIEYLPHMYRVLKDGSHMYIMTNHLNLQNILNTATNCGFHFIKSIIWNKGNKIMGQAYMSQFEYILFFRKGSFKKINNCGTSDILNIPNIKTKDENGENFLDVEKPIELFDILISNSSNEGDLVLDPFVGIGASYISAVKLKRSFIGSEIDVNNYNISISRYDNILKGSN